MIKYDYKAMVDENMDENHRLFKDGGLFKNIGAISIQNIHGHKTVLGFYHSARNETGRVEETYHYDIVLSQDGVTIENIFIKPKNKAQEIAKHLVTEASNNMALILEELRKYAFEPGAYELWTDNPDIPYYIRKGKQSLCSTVIPIGN